MRAMKHGAGELRPVAAVLIAVLTIACGSGSVTAPPDTARPSPTATALVTPATSPTPVPGSPTDPLEEGAWRTRLAMADGTYTLPVVLRDATGLVSGFAAGPNAGALSEEGVANPNGQRNLLAYSWVGGACDTVTNLTFERTNGGFRLRVATERSGDMCIMIGLGRQVLIGLSAPVDARSVILTTD